MKLQHRSGAFDDEGNEYYLEYTESPYKLVCKYLQNHPDVDITNSWAKSAVNRNIKEGHWVGFSLDLRDSNLGTHVAQL